MGPSTIDRSKRPLGVEAMTVQDRQRAFGGQGAMGTLRTNRLSPFRFAPGRSQ